MLLYAASPLFNGNSEYYSDFKNKDGEQLISLQYDKEKWKKALDAAEDAINEAHAAGHDLYTHLQAPVGISDAEKGYFNHRWSLVTMPSAGKYRYYLGLHRIPNEYSTNDSTSRIVTRIYHCSLWGLGSFNANGGNLFNKEWIAH